MPFGSSENDGEGPLPYGSLPERKGALVSECPVFQILEFISYVPMFANDFEMSGFDNGFGEEYPP